MIEVNGLTKKYGSLLAISDLQFKIAKGSVSCLLGANGAGKSTTLRIVAGVLGATRGTVQLCGHDIVTAPVEARRCLGYLAENAPLYQEMSPRQYLLYRAALKGFPRARHESYMREAARTAGCMECLDECVARLSRGYRQRVGLADALLGSPPILLLDEPSAGLDSTQGRALRDLVRQLSEQHAILISSQAITDVEAFCTNALVLQEGRLVADDTIEALRTRHGGVEIKLSLRDPERRARGIITNCGWQMCSTHDQGETNTTEFSIKPAPATEALDGALERLVATLAASGIGVRAVVRSAASLEAALDNLTQVPQRSLP